MTDVTAMPSAGKQHVYFSQNQLYGGNAASINGVTRAADISLRFAAIATGAAILTASTWAVIDAGKLVGPDAALVAALAAGVGIGSLLLPRANKGMAVAIIAALVCGEGFNFMSSAERIVQRRDNAASITTGDNSANLDAHGRLTAALTAQKEQRELANETVSLPSCARECRALLERQAGDAAHEVEEARRELGKVPVVRSIAPLADRLGVSPVTIDLLAAVLLSVGATLLGAILIGFAGRPGMGGTRHEPVAANFVRGSAVNVETPIRAAVPDVVQVSALVDGTHQIDNGDDHDPRPPRGGLPAPVSQRTKGLLALIAASDGHLAGSQRNLAERSGLSRSALNRALWELATAGVVDVVADRASGTVVTLRAA